MKIKIIIPWLMAFGISCGQQEQNTAPTPTPVKLASNDVSWLFPPPSTTTATPEALDERWFSLENLKDASDKPVLSVETFNEILKIAQAPENQVQGVSHQVKLPDVANSAKGWRVVAVRYDPSAPGFGKLAEGGKSFREVFGELPQIRLVVQPVEIVAGQPRVHDVALHLIYNFAKLDPAIGKPVPDEAKTQAIKEGLVKLKKLCADKGVSTDGPMNVHPGLGNNDLSSVLTGEMRKFLSQHLADARLGAAAIMALPDGDPEPWIFIPMIRRPGEKITPFKQTAVQGSPVAQMLSFKDGPQKVVFPKPLTNNLAANPVLPAPATGGAGVSTMPLFAQGLDMDKQMVPNVAARDIPDVIANPRKSHFFNTDCVSCHSETTRREILKLKPGVLAFKTGGQVPAIAAEVVPNQRWNVRNFGWFQRAAGQAITPTITQRTANETAEVVEHLKAGN